MARLETRIDRSFAALRARGEKGFVAYITAGDPNLDDTLDRVLRLEDAGVDVVELGVPFSDPLADGRVNQDAAARALASGATLKRLFETVKALRRRSDMPLLFFTYLNPFHAYGFERAVRDAAEAGVDGLLLLDLPLEEARPYARALRSRGLNDIRLVTPTSGETRIRRIVREANGFVYCVSRAGVTGMQKNLPRAAREVVASVRRHSDLPAALGFGVSSPAQARTAARAADAVVVGSAIVQRFHEAPATPSGRAATARWVSELVQAAKEG